MFASYHRRTDYSPVADLPLSALPPALGRHAFTTSTLLYPVQPKCIATFIQMTVHVNAVQIIKPFINIPNQHIDVHFFYFYKPIIMYERINKSGESILMLVLKSKSVWSIIKHVEQWINGKMKNQC